MALVTAHSSVQGGGPWVKGKWVCSQGLLHKVLYLDNLNSWFPCLSNGGAKRSLTRLVRMVQGHINRALSTKRLFNRVELFKTSASSKEPGPQEGLENLGFCFFFFFPKRVSSDFLPQLEHSRTLPENKIPGFFLPAQANALGREESTATGPGPA